MRLPKSLLTTLEGLVWAAVGGAATSMLEIREYLTKWQEFDIDYGHVGKLAAAGAILGGAMFLRDLAQRRNVAAAAAAIPPGMAMAGLAGLGTMGTAEGGPIAPAQPGAPQGPGD